MCRRMNGRMRLVVLLSATWWRKGTVLQPAGHLARVYMREILETRTTWQIDPMLDRLFASE